jgi:hypothetical protein
VNSSTSVGIGFKSGGGWYRAPLSHPYQLLSSTLSYLYQLLRRLFVDLYRIVALLVLWGVLVGVAAFITLIVVYATNHHWIIPRVVSPSDEAPLALMSQLVTSEQTLVALKLDLRCLGDSLAEMERHLAHLIAVEGEVHRAIGRELSFKAAALPQRSKLSGQKAALNQKHSSLSEQVPQLESGIQQDLKAGLIPKVDASLGMLGLAGASNQLIDSEINEQLWEESNRDFARTSTKYLEVVYKHIELTSEIEQLKNNIEAADQKRQMELVEAKDLQEAIATAQASPYYMSLSAGTVYVALVPYENVDSERIGAPVYGCMLNLLVCSQVGIVKRSFVNEFHEIHPVWRSDVRGHVIQLELKSPEAAKSMTLFVNSKPLFF